MRSSVVDEIKLKLRPDVVFCLGGGETIVILQVISILDEPRVWHALPLALAAVPAVCRASVRCDDVTFGAIFRSGTAMSLVGPHHCPISFKAFLGLFCMCIQSAHGVARGYIKYVRSKAYMVANGTFAMCVENCIW